MIVPDPTLKIVGIFGSNSTTPPEVKEAELVAAELLAVAVHQAGAVLLSGAEPAPDEYFARPDTVKDMVVYALRNAVAGDGATWVGVANGAHARMPREHRSAGIIVTPGWKHRRNFVEACLCDAAIAIGGRSPGTASEALFCCFLHRPVALVAGKSAASAAVTVRELKSRIGGRVGPMGEGAVDIGIAEAYAWAETANSGIEEAALPTDPASAERIVKLLLDTATEREPRPNFEVQVDELTWDRYVKAAVQSVGRWPLR